MTKKIKNVIALAVALGTIASISTISVSADCTPWEENGFNDYCATPICEDPDVPTKFCALKYVRKCDNDYDGRYEDRQTKTEIVRNGCC